MAIKNYTSSVDVYVSLGEIQGALAGHGARQIMVEYDSSGLPTGVTFAIDTPVGRRGYTLPANIDGVMEVFRRQKLKVDRKQAERTGWRNLRDWVLSQMAIIESGMVCAEDAFETEPFKRIDKINNEEFPTADVAPVRHGRWLYEPKFGSTRPYHCSLPDCGASYHGKFLH